MKLVLVTLGSGTALEVADVSPLVSDDECTLKLPRVDGIDTEVRGELHRTARTLRDVDEGAIAEDSGVQRSEVIIGIGDDDAQVLLHQLGVLAYGFAEGAEDDALLGEGLAEGRLHRYGVHDRVDGNP